MSNPAARPALEQLARDEIYAELVTLSNSQKTVEDAANAGLELAAKVSRLLPKVEQQAVAAFAAHLKEIAEQIEDDYGPTVVTVEQIDALVSRCGGIDALPNNPKGTSEAE